jgi:ribosome recycling factor
MKRTLLTLLPVAIVMVMSTILVPTPAETQPRRHVRIFEAIRSMEDAREYMRTARHDFCGHRERALEDTDRAIRQMREAAACERY